MIGPVLVYGADEALAGALRARGAELTNAEPPAGFGLRLEGAPRALVTAMPPPELEPLAELDPRAWQELFRRCVEEPFRLVQTWLRDVTERGPGAWVAVTTVLGTRPFPGGGSFGACAVALHRLVEIAAVEYGPRGLRANAVAVGWREGALPAALAGDGAAIAVEDTPAGRLARPDDVAAAVAWLLSPEAAHVNGEVVRVDGGYTLTRSGRAAPSELVERWLLEEPWWA